MSGVWIYTISILIASFAQMFLKKSALRSYANVLSTYINPWVIGGYGLLMCSMFLTALAYRTVPLSMGPILETLGIVFVTILSRIFYKEQITKNHLIGLGLIFMGVIVAYA